MYLHDLWNQTPSTPWQKKALEHFQRLGFPNRNTPHYHYANFKKAQGVDYTQPKPTPALQHTTPSTIHIHNGVLIACPNISGLKLELLDHSKVYNTQSKDPLYHLNHALASHCVVIRVTSNTQLNKPIKIHVTYDLNKAFIAHRMVIILEENSHALFYEHLEGDIHDSLILFGSDQKLLKNSTLHYYRSQSLLNGTLWRHDSATLYYHTLLECGCFDRGGEVMHGVLEVQLHQPHAQCSLFGILTSHNHQHCGNVFHITHQASHTKSEQHFKYLLKDHSKGYFDGLVHVTPLAQYAHVHQLTQALLLDEGVGLLGAMAPQLMIEIDELNASHGASIGALDMQAFDYLKSRGLTPQEARSLLIEAFYEEILQRISNSNVYSEITQVLKEVPHVMA